MVPKMELVITLKIINNLKKHLLGYQQNATYLSPTIQNEIIEICGNLITKTIIH